MVVEVPVKSRAGVVAHALVDERWEHLGERSWCLSHGYPATSMKVAGRHRMVMMHHLVLPICPPGYVRDHINRDRLDNREANLRFVTGAENQWNCSGNAGSSSEHRGVSWHAKSGKWMARCVFQGERHYLGVFEDELEAARVVAAYRATLR